MHTISSLLHRLKSLIAPRPRSAEAPAPELWADLPPHHPAPDTRR